MRFFSHYHIEEKMHEHMQYKLSNTVSVNFLFPEREKVVAESNRQQYSLAGFESSWLQQYCRWVRIQLDETIHINKKIF